MSGGKKPTKKIKYLFASRENTPLFMLGIIVDSQYLVTLTTAPNSQCAQYHHRMPLLVTDGISHLYPSLKHKAW